MRTHLSFYLSIILHLLWHCKLCGSTTFFPTNSAYGIFAAIAVPLELPHRNVFISYNFEANYNLPYTYDIPPIAYGVEEDEIFSVPEARVLQNTNDCANCTESITKTTPTTKITTTTNASTTSSTAAPLLNATILDSKEGTTKRRRRQKRSALNSLLTRTHFYHILMDKFRRSGYNAEPCLLRLICETNASGLGEVNGVLGSLVHIIFSPSTSAHENLPLQYYQAEVDGAHGVCEDYIAECEDNPLDLISVPLGEIIDDLMGGK
ncbi:unnamed protein product [Ceratitis capitata]|uniref:(Mediterranean fruit fly) hypothetical protein n=1 Tax=Ceratitis capitata TaxID=7213 RepID=A0A811VFE9_CERCA|nr:unnamed protein product [Ceratitis capitata]